MNRHKYVKAKEILWNIVKRKGETSPEDTRLHFLKHNMLFQGLTNTEMKRLREELYARQYSKDEYLFKMGQPGAVLFVIISGEVIVELGSEEGNSEQVELARLTPGAFLGELALLDESPRSASARANTPVEALALARRDLENLSQREPVIGVKIYHSLATIIGDRLKATNNLLNIEKAAQEKMTLLKTGTGE